MQLFILHLGLFMKNKLLLFSLVLFLILLTFSCSDNSTNTPADLKNGAAGTWLVTRTLVTPSTDFPAGYQDQQQWTITVNGESALLTTKDGSINGTWRSSQSFPSLHWVFEVTGTDPRFGTQIKIVVEVISTSPFKGTNETYYYDPYSGSYLISDGFSITGTRIK